MSNTSFYRKYRPNNFSEVVGQSNIINILEKSIKYERIAHAYIFNGPRGTGKTSIAKIFAKNINCTCKENLQCTLCLNLEKGVEIPDIWEIDAASNNGIDEIRNIIDNVDYVPLDLKYKVYIIDEVHMLSKQAFNALLKTLEEPPKHVVFILATTEIYKVPLTILSRCQRFDFKRISLDDIVKQLGNILQLENINFENEALVRIANLSDGAMRDALSLLEKVSVFSEVITLNSVNEALELVDDNNITQLVNSFFSGNIEEVINIYQQIIALGIDQVKFISMLEIFIKNLLLTNNDYKFQKQYVIILKELVNLESKLIYTKNYNLLIEIYFISITLSLVEQNKDNGNQDNHLENLKIQTKLLKAEELVKEEQVQISDEIGSQELEVDEIVEIVEEEKIESELLYSDSAITDYLNIESNNESIMKDDVKKYQEIDIDIYDILVKATKQEKVQVINDYMQIKTLIEQQRLYGLAKFFDLTKIQAVSSEGIIITIRDKYIDDYQEKLVDIGQYFMTFYKKSMQLYLLTEDKWLSIRKKYIESLENNSKEDIYLLAQETFGKDVVKKHKSMV